MRTVETRPGLQQLHLTLLPIEAQLTTPFTPTMAGATGLSVHIIRLAPRQFLDTPMRLIIYPFRILRSWRCVFLSWRFVLTSTRRRCNACGVWLTTSRGGQKCSNRRNKRCRLRMYPSNQPDFKLLASHDGARNLKMTKQWPNLVAHQSSNENSKVVETSGLRLNPPNTSQGTYPDSLNKAH